MRRLLITIAILLAVLVALPAMWIFGGRRISHVVDHFVTKPMESRPIDHVGYDGNEVGGTFEIGGSFFDTLGTNSNPFPLTLRPNEQNQFVVTASGKSFVLGPISTQTVRPRILPATGDHITLDIRRSALSWPTPFDVNYMTGHSSSWKRNLYYELHWTKPSGQKLEMVWRYEQYFYPNDGWASGFMTRPGATGLVRVKILGEP
jgi:hypothetical protein